jgi:hypothetical protein
VQKYKKNGIFSVYLTSINAEPSFLIKKYEENQRRVVQRRVESD